MTHPSIKLGRPGTFESVSAIKIVCNNPGPDIDWTHCGPDEGDKAALDGLRHKVVIVGETTGDVHQTDQGVMAGPELQANYIAALLDESFLIPSPQWVNDSVIVAWLLVLLAVFYGCKLPELALVVSAVITLGLGVFFSAVIRSQWGVFAAVVPPSILEIIGLYLARRIELAIRESAHGEPKSA
jgi:CHASE2 domain-containing sensor protein